MFTALPYIQPGKEGKLVPGAEVVRLAWQTLQAGNFEVEYGRGGQYQKVVEKDCRIRNYSTMIEGDSRFNYVYSCSGLELGTEYRYRVRCNGMTIMEGYFTTRQPRGKHIRFAAFGDNSFGEIGERAVAYQAYRANPDFIMNAGDNVYDSGLDNEYSRYFFPVYNAGTAAPDVGAPLLRSVPFYTVIANHDVRGKAPDTGGPCADFSTMPDSLGYYTNFYLPLSGPAKLAYPTRLAGDADDFRRAAGDRFPQMANYAYDYGDAHFLCLDSNVYVDPTDADLQAWIDSDLSWTDARWKFVVCHHPPFNVGAQHYAEQQMRVLSPLLEKHKVDFVLSGHEHNYQRTMPLRFAPGDMTLAHDLNKTDRQIPGQFTVDKNFDGVKVTKPEGVIYLTTGAGGKHLYEPGYTNRPTLWTHPDDNNVAYVAQMVADRHSLTLFDVEGDELTMRQVDEFGDEIDRIRVTKA